MKIREIRVAGLYGATPPGGWSNELSPQDSVHTLVSIHTDDGPIGIGSVFTNEALVRGSVALLEEMLVGRDPLAVGRITEDLHQNTFWLGRGGSVTHTISGINTALWDIAGQAYGQPIGKLIGGIYRDTVTPYASLLMNDPESLAEALGKLLEQGFRAFKIGWGSFGRKDAVTDEALIAAARSVVGPGLVLAVDAGGSDAYWRRGYKWAIQAARMLANYDVAWFEEPVPPDNLADFAALRLRSPIPISGGETFTRRQTYTPFVLGGAFDIVQPDVTKVGGISEMIAIGQLAEDNGVTLIPHGWNTGVGLAADLQIASALARTDLVEYCTGAAYIDEIVEGGWTRDTNGQLAIPHGPGLGMQWDHDRIMYFTHGVDLFTP